MKLIKLPIFLFLIFLSGICCKKNNPEPESKNKNINNFYNTSFILSESYEKHISDSAYLFPIKNLHQGFTISMKKNEMNSTYRLMIHFILNKSENYPVSKVFPQKGHCSVTYMQGKVPDLKVYHAKEGKLVIDSLKKDSTQLWGAFYFNLKPENDQNQKSIEIKNGQLKGVNLIKK